MRMYCFHLFFNWLLFILISNVTTLNEKSIAKNVKSEKSECNSAFPAVNCIWLNSSHTIDLSSLSYQSGNHFSFAKNVNESRIFFINLCRPLNPKKEKIQNYCPSTAGICMVDPLFPNLSISLGQPLEPIFKDKENFINAIYSEGDICLNNQQQRLKSSIKFICDPDIGNGIPHFIEVVDNCTFLFDWKTSLVCEPDLISIEDCIFKDKFTNNIADLTPILNKYRVSNFNSFDINNTEKILLNICGNKSLSIDACNDSAICYLFKNKVNNYTKSFGSLNSQSVTFDGIRLKISYTNGSLCNSNLNWSSELHIYCSASSLNSDPVIKNKTDCKALIEMNHDAVCSLMSPHCTFRQENFFFDFRVLSSITHNWFAKDITTNQSYFFNVCRHQTKDKLNKKSAAVRCWNENKQEKCDQIGLVDTLQFSLIKSDDNSTDNLVLKYTNGSNLCNNLVNASTKIIFICHSQHHKPKFIGRTNNSNVCEFNFEWKTYFACPIQIDFEEEELQLKDGFIIDKNNTLIDLRAVFNQTFETMSENDDGTVYNYTFNLNNTSDSTVNCQNAAICQKKVNDVFSRDIGSLQTFKIFKRGTEFKMVLTANNHQKCGKNKNKNVTTLVTFICDSKVEVGSPIFEYESNNCDYVFFWPTSLICPINFIYELNSEPVTTQVFSKNLSSTISTLTTTSNLTSFSSLTSISTLSLPSVVTNFSTTTIANTNLINTNSDNLSLSLVSMKSQNNLNQPSEVSFLRFVMLMIVVVITVLLVIILIINDEKRKAMVNRVRNWFRPSVPTSLHYSQVVSDSTKLVSLEHTEEF